MTFLNNIARHRAAGIALLALSSVSPLAAEFAVDTSVKVGANIMGATSAGSISSTSHSLIAAPTTVNVTADSKKVSKTAFDIALELALLYRGHNVVAGGLIEGSYSDNALVREQDLGNNEKLKHTLRSDWSTGFYGVLGGYIGGFELYGKAGIAGRNFQNIYGGYDVDANGQETEQVKVKGKSAFKWGFSAGAGLKYRFTGLPLFAGLDYTWTNFGKDAKESSFPDRTNTITLKTEMKDITSHRIMASVGYSF